MASAEDRVEGAFAIRALGTERRVGVGAPEEAAVMPPDIGPGILDNLPYDR